MAGFGLRVFWFQKLEVGTRGGWRDLEVGLKDLEVNPDLRLRIFAKSFESLLGFHHPFRLFVSETRSGWFRDFEVVVQAPRGGSSNASSKLLAWLKFDAWRL